RSSQGSKDGTPIRLRPVILNGPPGIGKSVWARKLAQLLQLPMAPIDAVMETLARASRLTGRRQSLRDVIRICERAAVLEDRPRLH
ncbi:MAG: hypothetical protein IIX61_07005, partial [Loktanella sp.]|nr:hypothetical protein [Loktanella sp.]